MNKMVKMFAAGLCLLSAHGAYANEPDNPWTDCGIGYALFQHSEIGAAISNVIWDAGTTATTTYVSSPESCRSRSGEVAQFIGETYESLERETAVGEGEHLQAMIEIAACDASAASSFISTVRSGFSIEAQKVSFEQLTRQEKAGVYYSIVDSTMKSSCQAS